MQIAELIKLSNESLAKAGEFRKALESYTNDVKESGRNFTMEDSEKMRNLGEGWAAEMKTYGLTIAALEDLINKN